MERFQTNNTREAIDVLKERILFLEKKLREAMQARPQCTEEAFQSYVNGAIEDAVAQERRTHSKYCRDLECLNKRLKDTLDEKNKIIEFVLKKYNLHIDSLTIEAKESRKKSLEHDPIYTTFFKMSTRGRCASLSNPI